MKKNVKKEYMSYRAQRRNLIMGALLMIFLVVASVIGALYIKKQRDDRSHASTLGITPKIAIADFYWWYPWFGMQWRTTSMPPGQLNAPTQTNGFVSQNAFASAFLQQIPYLKSRERLTGSTDLNAAESWYLGNFERAGAAKIDVLAVMTRPDLPTWPTALQLMIQAQKTLKAQGKPFPKLMFHFDGVEYWTGDNPVTITGQLTGPGRNFDTIWNGTKQTFDTVHAALSPSEIPDYFYTYPDSNAFPILVYRIEANVHSFTSSDWWTTQLKTNFASTYPGQSLYMILDSQWCHGTFANTQIALNTCNADNFYSWGAALNGALRASRNTQFPIIYDVGPGFDNSHLEYPPRYQDRQNGVYYRQNLQKANVGGADWIILETFNLGEEGSMIDSTQAYGTSYLDLTREFLTQWKGNTPRPSPSPAIISSYPSSLVFGNPSDTPLTGKTSAEASQFAPVSFRNGVWYVAKSLSDTQQQYQAFAFGQAGDKPLYCDWTGSGMSSPGIYRNGQWYILTKNVSGAADIQFTFGDSAHQYIPLCGDWNGSHHKNPGLFDPLTGQFLLRNSLTTGSADVNFTFGIPADLPIVGSWANNGKDSVGVFRNGLFLLRNSLSTGIADSQFTFGQSGDKPIVGNWDGTGKTQFGVVRGNQWFFK